MVYGNGSDTTDREAWKMRARKKKITQKLMLALIDVAKEKGDLKRVQKYWNAFHCQSTITYSKSKAYGNYCKSKYCLVCLGIRKATPKFIQDYQDAKFDRTINDWVCKETGELLTGYVCSPKLSFLLEHGIDKERT